MTKQHQAQWAAIWKWQTCPVLNTLLCRRDVNHDPLQPAVVDREIVLICPTCGHIQREVPQAVYDLYEECQKVVRKFYPEG